MEYQLNTIQTIEIKGENNTKLGDRYFNQVKKVKLEKSEIRKKCQVLECKMCDSYNKGEGFMQFMRLIWEMQWYAVWNLC